MASHIVGYPRMGPKRELKFALESFWDGKSSADDLKKVAAELRSSIWKQMKDAGIKFIPSNTFSYYDQVLDTTAMLGAVPPRYGWNGGEIEFGTYFSMARGNASVPAMEMTKWFDTNYHFIVPELGPEVKFSYASHKAVQEYKEAKALGVETVPVLVGPVSYLLLSKPAKGVEKSFSLLSLLDKILPIYKEVIAELKAAGASWIQFDEPTLVKDLESHQLQAFTSAYSALESSLSGLNGTPVVNHLRSAPPAIQLTSADQVLPAHQRQFADPAPPAFQRQSVDQAPPALQQQSIDPEAQWTLGSSNTHPDAPRSVTSGISAATFFEVLLGVIFAAAEGLMLHYLQQPGNMAPASSKIALTIVFVTFLLAFLFIATGACMYKRFALAAFIIGNAGFFCITLSFFAMVHVCVSKHKHLVGFVWTICGILLLVFAYFFKEDLKDRCKK